MVVDSGVDKGVEAEPLDATLESSSRTSKYPDGARTYPRIVSAWTLLEEEEDPEPVFCGPPSEDENSEDWELRALAVWGIGLPEPEVRRKPAPARAAPVASTGGAGTEVVEPTSGGGGGVVAQASSAGAADSAASWDRAEEPHEAQAEARTPQPLLEGDVAPSAGFEKDAAGQRMGRRLLLPEGDQNSYNPKFICAFPIGLEDDEEFCLVKRIIGKGGNNMRRIAQDYNAKLRLRGFGSGYLEGVDRIEANVPLQLNVSCVNFDDYCGAVQQVENLLNGMYKHYRRYARSKNMEVPELKVTVEEVRRRDLPADALGPPKVARLVRPPGGPTLARAVATAAKPSTLACERAGPATWTAGASTANWSPVGNEGGGWWSGISAAADDDRGQWQEHGWSGWRSATEAKEPSGSSSRDVVAPGSGAGGKSAGGWQPCGQAAPAAGDTGTGWGSWEGRSWWQWSASGTWSWNGETSWSWSS